MNWAIRGYVLMVVGMLSGSTMTGWRWVTAPAREKLTPGDHTHSVRSSPGGYRSYHFWHSGFSGGK
jgi:hypothetical protein